MTRLSASEKHEFMAMVYNPEKMGVAITHNQLRALMLAQTERDALVDRLAELEEVREDDAGLLYWICSGDAVADMWE